MVHADPSSSSNTTRDMRCSGADRQTALIILPKLQALEPLRRTLLHQCTVPWATSPRLSSVSSHFLSRRFIARQRYARTVWVTQQTSRSASALKRKPDPSSNTPRNEADRQLVSWHIARPKFSDRRFIRAAHLLSFAFDTARLPHFPRRDGCREWDTDSASKGHLSEEQEKRKRR